MNIKKISENVIKNCVKNTVQKPSASWFTIGMEKMPESLKKER